MRRLIRVFLAVCASGILIRGIASGQTLTLAVDLTDAPRNIFHERLTVPAKPGAMTLVYPKWIPGNHRPSGPIANLVGLRFRANAAEIPWQRDELDMYAFHVNVPAGARQIEVSYDTTTSDQSAGATGSSASSNVLDLNWNQVVLYPENSNSDAVQFAASVHLPAGWKFGTALPVEKSSGDVVEFSPVSLTTLVDSPLIAGSHYRRIELTNPGETPSNVMDLVSESDAGLEMTDSDLSAYRSLVREAGALFGAYHYTNYHFLYTLSDQVGHHGLEHHQSSDNSSAERTLTDPNLHLLESDLLPHEFVHSWNGKYRRPAGLATRNYQEPMVGNLLWVYEGLTEYLGEVLAARSGLRTAEEYREAVAANAAELDHRAGRTWRPLEDTARSVQTLRLASRAWSNWRRGTDYYGEGSLIWLEVDTKIRQLTSGQKSLDDFCHAFHGGQTGPPKVVPYEFSDVVKTLNDVAPYDWASLLKKLAETTTARAPLEGIEAGGWKLVYTDKPNLLMQASEKTRKTLNADYSLGFEVAEGGALEDVIPGSPAYQAGIGPGMKLVAVNGRRWSKEVLRDVLRASTKSGAPIELLVENHDFFKTYPINYHEGERYPHLVRVEGDDLLGKIIQRRTNP